MATRTVLIPMPLANASKKTRRAEERAAAASRAKLDRDMAACLARLAQQLVRKRHGRIR